jgi:hypothetical protein
MKLFVSGATATVRKHAASPYLGHLLTPDNGNTESVWGTGLPVGCDNGCFKRLNKARFIRMCKSVRHRNVLWVTAPDVVSNAAATLVRFRMWAPVLEYYDLPIAFVAQDGQETLPVPWDRIRCLFIGGSTEWKLGPHAASLIEEARQRGKWTHVGRVNSHYRLNRIDAMHADSFDGYLFSRAPKWIKWFLQRLEYEQHGIFFRQALPTTCANCESDWTDIEVDELSIRRSYCPVCTAPLQGRLYT